MPQYRRPASHSVRRLLIAWLPWFASPGAATPIPSLAARQVIRVSSPGIRKPPGILWERLSPQKLAQIRILQQLKKRIEGEQGFPLPTGPDEVLPPLAQRGQRKGGGGGRGGGGRGRGGGRGNGRGEGRPPRQRSGGRQQAGRGQAGQ